MKVLEGRRSRAQIVTLCLLCILFSCKENDKQDQNYAHTNDLIHETSPYLLQHELH